MSLPRLLNHKYVVYVYIACDCVLHNVMCYFEICWGGMGINHNCESQNVVDYVTVWAFVVVFVWNYRGSGFVCIINVITLWAVPTCTE